MVPRESSITKAIMRWLESGGLCPLKWHGGKFGKAGVPDILCFESGHAVWFEVKRPGGKPTALQDGTMNKLRAAGCRVYVVTSLEEAQRAFAGGSK